MTNIPETQGQKKLLRYIKDLIRNAGFLKDLKRYKRHRGDIHAIPQLYKDMSLEQQQEHDYLNREIGSIIDAYEQLRKRAKRVFDGRAHRKKLDIAEKYGLNSNLLGYAEALLDDEKKAEEFREFLGIEFDMCQIESPYDEELAPFNKGEEIIYLKPHRQVHVMTYPIAVGIHERATKRDVLDFIDKRWPWIESNLRLHHEKGLKNRPRKHKQEVLDFIWDNRQRPPKKIKNMLDKKHSGNGLVYYEIQEIIRQEKKRRTQDLT